MIANLGVALRDQIVANILLPLFSKARLSVMVQTNLNHWGDLASGACGLRTAGQDLDLLKWKYELWSALHVPLWKFHTSSVQKTSMLLQPECLEGHLSDNSTRLTIHCRVSVEEGNSLANLQNRCFTLITVTTVPPLFITFTGCTSFKVARTEFQQDWQRNPANAHRFKLCSS